MVTLVSNSGSNSRKYALYDGYNELASFLFDPNIEDPHCEVRVDGKISSYRGEKLFKTLDDSSSALEFILHRELGFKKCIDQILFRIVATGDYFTEDHVIDDECMTELRKIESKTPLHVPVVINEIESLRRVFSDSKIIAISDSKFHTTMPDANKYYPIDTDFANKYGIKRYGAHGLSMQSISSQLSEAGKMKDKIVVCHIGSGCSVTALKKGKSFDTTMGYTPLEGVMMATRCGDVDIAIFPTIKNATGWSDDEVGDFLNKKCGLLGVGGSNDFRVIDKNKFTDEKCALAYEMFVSLIQKAIGKMVASLHGIDALVLTATIPERNSTLRNAIVNGMEYLNICIDHKVNAEYSFLDGIKNIGLCSSKPIYVVPTNETIEMLKQAQKIR